ncbi:hypothetical protein ElyMa_006041400 [Elysia marginata]|uniref:Uncharacterized protein n=1 Tax=Elysia marginata TaxID=1093978 RepID=A0AAV4GKF7_9GAST|nr:hypothetical protein ElyMa_006041400 [Elysia marginata]
MGNTRKAQTRIQRRKRTINCPRLPPEVALLCTHSQVSCDHRFLCALNQWRYGHSLKRLRLFPLPLWDTSFIGAVSQRARGKDPREMHFFHSLNTIKTNKV